LDERPFHRCRPSRLVWGAAAILVLAVAVYAWAAWVGQLFWQDRPTLDGATSIFSLTHFWTQAGGDYRPLSLSVLWLERRGFGRSPLPYHCVGIALHAASSILLWLILRRLNVRGAWLAAALFAVLPAQAQAVIWISRQPQLLCALLCLLTIWIYLRWARIRPPLPKELADREPTEPPHWGGYAWALVVGLMAMLSGPEALGLPFVLLLLVWWKRGSVSRADWARLAPFFALALMVAVAGVLAHHRSIDSLALVAPAPSLSQRILIAGRAIGVYVINLFRVYPPELIHPRWDPAWNVWNVLPIVLIAALAIVAGAGRRRWGLGPVAGILLFVVLLLPGIIMALSQAAPAVYVADYRAYLAWAVPLAVIGMALIALSEWLARFMALRTARAAVGIVVIAALASFAAMTSLSYRDADTAFKATLAHHPANLNARAQYALYLEDQDPAKALQVLDEAGSGPDATDPTLLAARAHVCVALGRHDEAISTDLLAQRLLPDHPGVRVALAEAYDAAGAAAAADGRRDDAFEDDEAALAAYDAARQLIGRDHEAIDDGVGRVLLHEGRIQDSMERFDAAMNRNPAFVPPHVHKAQALFDSALQNNDPDKLRQSSAEIHEALSINPGSVEALQAAAAMQFRLGQFPTAELYARSAIQSDPRSPRSWTDLGLALAMQHRYPDAVHSFEQALTLRPDTPDALREKQLAEAELQKNKGNEKS
jgi:tetratricopeptide (TPR) repeat protein